MGPVSSCVYLCMKTALEATLVGKPKSMMQKVPSQATFVGKLLGDQRMLFGSSLNFTWDSKQWVLYQVQWSNILVYVGSIPRAIPTNTA